MSSSLPLDDRTLLDMIQSGDPKQVARARAALLGDETYVERIQKGTRWQLRRGRVFAPHQEDATDDAVSEITGLQLALVFGVEVLPRNVVGFDPGQGTLRNWLWVRSNYVTRTWIRDKRIRDHSTPRTEGLSDPGTGGGTPEVPRADSSETDFARFQSKLDQLAPLEHAGILIRFLPYLRSEEANTGEDPPAIRLAIRDEDLDVLVAITARDRETLIQEVEELDRQLEKRRLVNPQVFESILAAEAKMGMLSTKRDKHQRDKDYYARQLASSGITQHELDEREQAAIGRTLEDIKHSHGCRRTPERSFAEACQRLANVQRQLEEAQAKLLRAEDRVCPLPAEIAEFLSRSKSSIESAISRGRTKLKMLWAVDG